MKNSIRLWFGVITSALILLSVLSVGCTDNESDTDKEKTTISHIDLTIIDDSINKAITFLYENQTDYGEFKTYVWRNNLEENYSFYSSPFVTTFVLYSIKDVKNEKVEVMIDKGIEFLLSEEEPGGLWRFYTSKNSDHLYWPPDLDDISTISFILKLNKISFDNNLELVLGNRNEDGLFYTFIMDDNEGNDIDYVVNTNVLLYLGQSDSTVCSYINNAIKLNKFSSLYYPDNLTLFYMISRAFENNITSFEESKDIIIQATLNRQKGNGSFGNDLQTAFALNTLLSFNYQGEKIELGVKYLLQKQSTNGSWDRAGFFKGGTKTYWGSEEFTTALVIEALNKYLQIHMSD